ncbi:hypothetical protein [Streptomyces sp. NPDC005302]|uniref:hypothetical protein n=1 Tax=Streptomyces sp. NPDC005302 TaxID=3154675 RepID=UPI0033AF9F54
MTIELSCMHDADDRVSVYRDSDGEIAFRTPGASVYTTDEDARAFGRKILALVDGDEPAPVAEVIRVGDRVEILPSRQNTTTAGRVGVVTSIDVYDDQLPYRIATEDPDPQFVAWASQVRKIGAPPASSDARDDTFSRAKLWLVDTEHTAADIIRLAEFLAGPA